MNINEIVELEWVFLCKSWIYNKFTKLWDSLQIKDKQLTTDLAQKIKNFSWFLFIVTKIKLFPSNDHDITEIVILLYAVLRKVIANLPPEVSCEIIANCQNSEECI